MTTYSKVFSGTTVLYKAASVEMLFYDNIFKTETYKKLYTFCSILVLYTSYLIFIKRWESHVHFLLYQASKANASQCVKLFAFENTYS